MSTREPEDLICAVLRGEDVSWPSSPISGFEDAFVYQARYHGVAALLHEQVSRQQGWPQAVLDALRQQALGQAMWELRHQQILSQLIEELDKFGVAPILFKGTALAYGLYPNPLSRARGDTDIIIALRDLTRCKEILLSQGFRRSFGIPGDLISYEECWTLIGPEGGSHSIDLHRRISNSELLSRLFTYDEIRASAHPLPALCPHALAADRVHALLLACMHRATHMHNPYYTDGIPHYGGNRLIWLYDIHLLTSVLTEEEWADVVRLARAKELAGTCLDGLEQTRKFFASSAPEFVLSGLREAGANERPAIYLKASGLRQQWMDFRAIEGASNKFVFLKETLFPPEGYMRSKYPEAHARALPYLYARRVFGGVAKKLQRDRRAS